MSSGQIKPGLRFSLGADFLQTQNILSRGGIFSQSSVRDGVTRHKLTRQQREDNQSNLTCTNPAGHRIPTIPLPKYPSQTISSLLDSTRPVRPNQYNLFNLRFSCILFDSFNVKCKITFRSESACLNCYKMQSFCTDTLVHFPRVVSKRKLKLVVV